MNGNPVINIIGGIVIGGFIIWLAYRSLRNSGDAARLIFKWVLSLGIGWVMFKVALPEFRKGSMEAMGGLGLGMICSFAIVVLWREWIIELIGKPFSSLYDGGGRELEARPFYSIARAKQKRGKYDEAIKDVRAQLVKFPNDFEGQMLIAEIQAEGQNDLASAEVTVQRFCNQKGHTANEIIFAWNALADWHLKYTQDVDAARADLERIIELFPGSEFSLAATQRIAHLVESHQVMMERHDHRRIVVKEGLKDMGLMAAGLHAKAPEVPPEQAAADCVKQLEAHPLDMDTRERLAVIYANHYQRLDLATDQLEQMIGMQGQPAKSIVRWLNLLADLQIKISGDHDTVKRTLERIIELSPDVAAANMARTRLSYLKLQLKGKGERNANIKLGSYEQDIGLKGGTGKEG